MRTRSRRSRALAVLPQLLSALKTIVEEVILVNWCIGGLSLKFLCQEPPKQKHVLTPPTILGLQGFGARFNQTQPRGVGGGGYTQYSQWPQQPRLMRPTRPTTDTVTRPSRTAPSGRGVGTVGVDGETIYPSRPVGADGETIYPPRPTRPTRSTRPTRPISTVDQPASEQNQRPTRRPRQPVTQRQTTGGVNERPTEARPVRPTDQGIERPQQHPRTTTEEMQLRDTRPTRGQYDQASRPARGPRENRSHSKPPQRPQRPQRPEKRPAAEGINEVKMPDATAGDRGQPSAEARVPPGSEAARVMDRNLGAFEPSEGSLAGPNGLLGLGALAGTGMNTMNIYCFQARGARWFIIFES